MSRICQSPKLPAETRKEQLLHAASELFVVRGYQGTSTHEIARAAGLTKGALYFHFKSKEDILLALIKRINESYRRLAKRLAPKSLTPAQAFRLMFELGKKMDYPDYRVLLDISVQAMKVPRARRFMKIAYRERLEIYASLIDPRCGLSRGELKQLAVFSFSLFYGLAARHMVDPTAVQIPKQILLFETLFPIPLQSRRSKSA